MPLQVVRERLLHVENHPIDSRLLIPQPVENPIHIPWVRDRAIEISRQPINAILEANRAHLDQTAVIPVRIIAAQLDLEAFEPVALNPILQQHGVSVVRFLARQLRFFQQIQPPDQMPSNQALWAMRGQEVSRILALEGNP